MSEPDVNPDIPYSGSFPLPFRVLALVGLGVVGWATNLHGLDLLGVDAPSVLELRTLESPSLPRTSPRPGQDLFKKHPDASVHYDNVYRIAGIYGLWVFATWLIYVYHTHGDPSLIDTYGYLPALAAVIAVCVLLCPFNVFYKYERDKFRQTLRRCLFISMDGSVYFADVVFADILTSFAKVFGDMSLSLRMLLSGNTMLSTPVEHGWIQWLAPTIMSLPYFIRFRQCIVEWSSSENESNRPLYNAIKYATAFPVIYLSAAQRIVEDDIKKDKGLEAAHDPWHGEHPLFRLWLLSAAVNSLYSYWWDVTNDWGLTLLKPNDSASSRRAPPRPLVLPHLHSGTSLLRSRQQRQSEDSIPTPMNRETLHNHPYGLRSTLLYPLPVYPLMVFLNFVLRMTWSIKLSVHLHSKSDESMAIFMIEIAEIFRRWMWVFLRVEWEIIKNKKARETSSAKFENDDQSNYEMIPPTPSGEAILVVE